MTSTPFAQSLSAQQNSRQTPVLRASGPPNWLRRLALGLSLRAVVVLIVATRGKLGLSANGTQA
ncbi:hypothetical protein [Kibdelosporangium aridum]|uniref:hypothetical protein n=1 Tax=Kibdelosporangium aridum TaxID=2030 RepID=UPI0005272664